MVMVNAATKGRMHQHRGSQSDGSEALHGQKHAGSCESTVTILYRIAGRLSSRDF